MTNELKQMLTEAGAFQIGETAADKIHFSQEIRVLCENNACNRYGSSWSCPPATGTVEECAAKCGEFKNVLVFNKKYELEDSFDFEGMLAGHADFNALVRGFARRLKEVTDDCLLLTAGGCDKCGGDCAYPNAPCRFPEELLHPVEGFGIYVNELCASAGINYINGANTVTYIGALLYNE